VRTHELLPPSGSRRPRKRVGRGIAAGQGKTAGRGQKGQGSRSSVDLPKRFEGGQMALTQRLPKLRGFHNINRREFATVNLAKLNRFAAGTEVSPQLLLETGLVRKPLDGIKILAAGELKVALKVSAHRFSAVARTRIEAAGGQVELLGPQPEPKPKVDAKAAAARQKRMEEADEEPDEEPAAAEASTKESPAESAAGAAPAEGAAEDQAESGQESPADAEPGEEV
jgi:large subunit ribosomal protein L15